MIEQLNETVRKEELENTYTIVETKYGSFRLQQLMTEVEIMLSFDSKDAAKKYAARVGYTII